MNNPVIIIGAGNAGEDIAREIRQNCEELKICLVGFIDDDRSKRGLMIQGSPVFGGRDELKVNVEKFGVDEVIIAIPSANCPRLIAIFQ